MTFKLQMQNTIIIDRGLTNALKFLCCLLVALSHYAQYAIINGLSSNLLINLISTQGGYLGVSIFFLLSGYGLGESMRKRPTDFRTFAIKRISKVYVPAVVVSLIWVIILWLFPNMQANTTGLDVQVANSNIAITLLRVFLLSFQDSVLWFVKVIMVLYLSFYLYHIAKKKNSVIALVLLIAESLAVAIVTYFLIAPFASVSVFAFVLGVVVSDYNQFISNNKWVSFIGGLITIVVIAFCVRHNGFFLHGCINYVLLLCFLLCTCLFEIRLDSNKYLGCLSYDLYLTHNKFKIWMATYYPSMNILFFTIAIVGISVCYNWIYSTANNTIKKWM